MACLPVKEGFVFLSVRFPFVCFLSFLWIIFDLFSYDGGLRFSIMTIGLFFMQILYADS